MKIEKKFIQDGPLKKEQFNILVVFFRAHRWLDEKMYLKIDLDDNKFREKVYAYAKEHYDDRELFISAINAFLTSNREDDEDELSNFCQIDKIYDSTEFTIKLLKYLQGDEGKTREEIAKHFNVSRNSIDKRLEKFNRNINILGNVIKIDLGRGTNSYDSTVHPIFLTLNLSEVYTLLTILKKAEQSLSEKAITHIIQDIIGQLTQYALNRLKKVIGDIDSYKKPASTKVFRQESSEDLIFMMKANRKCIFKFKESQSILEGFIEMNFFGKKDYVFTPINADPIEIDRIEIEDIIDPVTFKSVFPQEHPS